MYKYLSTFTLVLAFALSQLAFSASASQDILKEFYVKQNNKQNSDVSAIGMTLDGEFGFLYASGNTNTSTFKAALTSDHELENWSNRYLSELLYKQNKSNGEGSSSVVTAQRFLASAQLDYKLSNAANRLFVYAEYEDDRFSGFRYQTSFATGWSSVAWKDESSQFRYSIGPGYSHSQLERYDDANNALHETFNEMIIRGSFDYRLNVSSTTKFRQQFSTEAGEQNRRTRSETSLSTNLVQSLGMKLSFVMLYNDALSDTNKGNELSTETTISLVYQFF